MADQTTSSTSTDSADTAETAADAVEIDIQNVDGEAQNLTANIDQAPDETPAKSTEKNSAESLSEEQVQTLLDLAQTDPELAESLEQLGQENPQALEELVEYLEGIQTSAGGDDGLGLNGEQLGELFRSGLREILDAQRQSAQGGVSGDSGFASEEAQGGLTNDSRFFGDSTDNPQSNSGGNNRNSTGGDSAPAGDTTASAPELATTDATGLEDTSIPLTLSSALTDTDGSESLTIIISGIPSGASLANSNGPLTVSAGQISLTADQLDGLAITPPANSDTDFTLTVVATSTESNGGATNTVTDTLDVTVGGVADAPTATAGDVSGDEDTAIALDLSSALSDTSETLTAQITGVPAGATLSHGTDQGSGVWSVDPGDLGSVTITPPDDFSGTINLQLEATSTDGRDTATTSNAFSVTVAGVADAPAVTAGNVSGDEDTAIALNLSAAVTDASETLSVQITGFPSGTTVSHGTINAGVWTVDAADLGSVTITPPSHYSGQMNLQIEATSADGSDTASTSDGFTVTVGGVADAPTASAENVSGDEDTAIALDLSAALSDTSETLSVQITGFPSGATVSHGSISGGVWTVDPADLGSVTITPPTHYSGQMNLQMDVTSTDGSDTATTTASFAVSVAGIADAPTATAQNVTGNEDSAIALNLSASLADGSETLTVQLTGVPSGATLSHGTDQGSGVWSIDPADLGSVTLTPPQDFAGSINLQIQATSADGADTAGTNAAFTVTVDAVADAPDLTVSIGAATENEAEPDTSGVTESGTSSTEFVIGGAGDDTLTGGSDGEDFIYGGDGDDVITGSDGIDEVLIGGAGNDTLTAGDDDGSLLIGGTGNDIATGGDSDDLYVFAVGDGTDTFHGGGGTDYIALLGSDGIIDNINDITITMTNGSYAIDGDNVNFSSGATGHITLSDGSTLHFDGVERLELDDSFKFDGGGERFRAADQSGDSVNADSRKDSNVFGSDGNDVLSGDDKEDYLSGGAGNDVITGGKNEDFLDGGAGNDTLSGGDDEDVLIGGAGDDVLDGGAGTDIAVFQGARDQYFVTDNGDGTYTVADRVSDRDGSDTVENVETFSFGGVEVSAGNLISTNPDSSEPLVGSTTYELNISNALTDTDGSETLSAVTISGVPSGGTLSTGTDNGSGNWTVQQADLANLTITVPADTGSVDLTTAVTAMDSNGDTETTTVTVQIDRGASTPELSATHEPNTDGTFDINITGTLTDTDGSESLSYQISGIPSGATLSNDNGAVTVSSGTANLAQADLAGLKITPPPGDTGTINTANATSTGNGFTVTARNIVNGNLTSASAGNVSTTGSGFGADGNTDGPTDQIGYDFDTSQSEQVIVGFDNDLSEMTVSTAALYGSEGGSGNSEQGTWEAYKDGVLVGQGSFVASSGATTATFTIDLGSGNTFDQVIFGADHFENGDDSSSAASDYYISSIDYTEAAGAPFNLTVTATATESADGDTASATTTLEVDPGEIMDGADTATFSGTSGDDYIDYSNETVSSTDTIDGGDGNDVLDFANATLNNVTQISGGDGNDVLDFASATLNNVATIDGGAGADTITGSSGNDRIDGGAGADALTGGAGDDTFVLHSGAVDQITDFSASDDTLDLSDIVSMGSGDEISAYLQIEDDGEGNSVVKVNSDGSEGGNFESVAVLQGVTGLDIQQLFNSGNVVVDES